MAISKEFQIRFKELVGELGLKNKTEIAERMGITYATFAKIFNYGIYPTVPILIRIADFFGVSIEYLVGNTETEKFMKSDAPIKFTERLEELKLSKGISTTYELAQRIHIHRNNIAQWLKHDYIPSLDDLILIADYFDVTLDYLLGRTDDVSI